MKLKVFLDFLSCQVSVLLMFYLALVMSDHITVPTWVLPLPSFLVLCHCVTVYPVILTIRETEHVLPGSTKITADNWSSQKWEAM